MRNLILLAVQGAGKGTLAKALSEKFGYVHISTGDILRERASVEDELGKKIKDLIDNGIFVPNDIIYEAMEYKITRPECKNGYILDGFPRNIEQAHGYEEMAKRLGIDMGIAINMTLKDELLKQRIIGRRVCKDCGAIYNVYSDNEQFKPKKEGVCNKCGGPLYQRDDDNEEAMKKRINTYFEVTTPIIDYYKEKGILYEVDSTDSDKTFEEVVKILKTLGDKVD